MDINTDKIRELADLALEKQLAELIVQDGDKSVTIKLPGHHLTHMLHAPSPLGQPHGQAVVYAPPAPGPIAELPVMSSHAGNEPEAHIPHPDERLHKITSPMVGTFYAAPSPDSPPFVTVGQSIAHGQTICIIEAMKMMNELETEVSGKVVRMLVENGQPVEFGQVLMLVELN
jgi:acetyl-CoA carboxylase biotin carboxyl carrier protein